MLLALVLALATTPTPPAALSPAEIDARLPRVIYHVVPRGSNLRAACGAYTFAKAAPLDGRSLVIRCVKPRAIARTHAKK